MGHFGPNINVLPHRNPVTEQRGLEWAMMTGNRTHQHSAMGRTNRNSETQPHRPHVARPLLTMNGKMGATGNQGKMDRNV